MFGKKIKLQNSIRIFLSLFALALISLGCQRDDICPESTLITPLLKIAFIEAEPEVAGDTIPKIPTNLSVRAVGVDTDYPITVNTSEISIPLKTDADFTTYQFTLNTPADSDTTSEGNTDVINFTYARNESYINRACSFKVTYINLEAEKTPDTNNWIKRIRIDQSTVEDEKITNISIFH